MCIRDSVRPCKAESQRGSAHKNALPPVTGSVCLLYTSYTGAEWERRYRDCVADARISKRVVTVKELVRLILRSAVELSLIHI